MARIASANVMHMSQIILLVGLGVALDQIYSQLGYARLASSSL